MGSFASTALLDKDATAASQEDATAAAQEDATAASQEASQIRHSSSNSVTSETSSVSDPIAAAQVDALAAAPPTPVSLMRSLQPVAAEGMEAAQARNLNTKQLRAFLDRAMAVAAKANIPQMIQ